MGRLPTDGKMGAMSGGTSEVGAGGGAAGPDESRPVLPVYGGGCVADIVPAVLEPGPAPPRFLPPEVIDARAVVVLVIDGLGWEQLAAHSDIAPTLAGMAGGSVTTVVPSTTSAALTSIVTGTAPGRHGIVGYRVAFPAGKLNILRWTTPEGDARDLIAPEGVQVMPPFMGHRAPAVIMSGFIDSGFTRAHLGGARLSGYLVLSGLAVEVARLLAGGESFVYAYYDGPDRVAHEYGFDDRYRAELRACDRVVADLLSELPAGSALVVTSDHGLVDCTGGTVEIDAEVKALAAAESGEARFRWLHARPGRARSLLEAARAAHGGQAWVMAADAVVEEGWLGPAVTDQARSRLGHVALVARGDVAFTHSDDSTPETLKGRHGSVTAAEMLVPVLTHVAD